MDQPEASQRLRTAAGKVWVVKKVVIDVLEPGHFLVQLLQEEDLDDPRVEPLEVYSDDWALWCSTHAVESMSGHTAGKDLLFGEWRAANRQAHGKEWAIVKAYVAAADGQSPWPSQHDRDEVKRLRTIASDLFQVAMAQIEDRAKANKRT